MKKISYKESLMRSKKNQKRLISKKAKETDQTAQAIKQSINKRFDDFFDETENH